SPGGPIFAIVKCLVVPAAAAPPIGRCLSRNPLAERPLIHSTRPARPRDARGGTRAERFPLRQFCGLGKAAGDPPAVFLVPLFGKGAPQPFPVVFAEPLDLFQERVERLVGFG